MSQTPNQPESNNGNGASEDAIVRSRSSPYGVDLFTGPIAPPELPPTFDFKAIWRFRWTMLAVVAVVAPALIALVWNRVEPQYESTAVIHVASVVPRVLYKMDDNGKMPLYGAYLNTQVSLIQSPEVLERVFDRDDVRQTRWFQSSSAAASNDIQAAAERLGRQLSVRPRRGTELIDVSIETLDARESQIIVNAVVEVYKKYWDDLQVRADERRLATLRGQREQIDEEITSLFDLKYELSEQLGSNVHEEVRAQRLGQLNSMKAGLQQMRAEQAVRKYERTAFEAGKMPEADSDAMVRATGSRDKIPSVLTLDPTWQEQFAAFEDAKRRLALAQKQFGSGHPSYQAVVADLENSERILRLTEARLLPGGYSTDHAEAVQGKREEQLVASINTLQSELAAVDRVVNELGKAEERYVERKALRKELTDRLHALEMERNAPARVSLQSPGTLRRKPSSDRRLIYSACAMAATIILAAGIGFLRSRTDSTIHAYADISSSVPNGVPFLGQLPRARDALGEPEDSLLGRAINENMRIVRTMMLQRLHRPKGTVVVTSPEASAGKTTVSILLARSLVRMGKRVLLVDADMLHPSVSQYFELSDRVGLRSVMSGEISDEDAFCNTDDERLAVLPAGAAHGPSNRDVLANGAFTSALTRWQTMFDYVVMDSPPVLAMADARIAAGHADGVVMVLRADGSRRDDAVEAFAGLSACGAKLLGTMLVGVRTGTGYYPYQYHRMHADTADLLA